MTHLRVAAVVLAVLIIAFILWLIGHDLDAFEDDSDQRPQSDPLGAKLLNDVPHLPEFYR